MYSHHKDTHHLRQSYTRTFSTCLGSHGHKTCLCSGTTKCTAQLWKLESLHSFQRKHYCGEDKLLEKGYTRSKAAIQLWGRSLPIPAFNENSTIIYPCLPAIGWYASTLRRNNPTLNENSTAIYPCLPAIRRYASRFRRNNPDKEEQLQLLSALLSTSQQLYHHRVGNVVLTQSWFLNVCGGNLFVDCLNVFLRNPSTNGILFQRKPHFDENKSLQNEHTRSKPAIQLEAARSQYLDWGRSLPIPAFNENSTTIYPCLPAIGRYASTLRRNNPALKENSTGIYPCLPAIRRYTSTLRRKNPDKEEQLQLLSDLLSTSQQLYYHRVGNVVPTQSWFPNVG